MLDQHIGLINISNIQELPSVSTLQFFLLHPLQSEPGCLVWMQEWLYFQPAGGVEAGGMETPKKSKL